MSLFARSAAVSTKASAKTSAKASAKTPPAKAATLPSSHTKNTARSAGESAVPAEVNPPEANPPEVKPASPQAARATEPACFEDIVERYHGKVFQLVYRYTGDYEEASDLTQDTFVRAYGAWSEFRGDSQIYTWLYRIAINLCHNQQKKLQRRRRVEGVSLDTPVDEDSYEGWSTHRVADERPLPLQVLESHELRARLHDALHQLPDNYRTVIVLRDIEGLTYEEIARVTDSTLEAIKSRLFRARNAVRRLMEPYLIGPLPIVPTEEEAQQSALQSSQFQSSQS